MAKKKKNPLKAVLHCNQHFFELFGIEKSFSHVMSINNFMNFPCTRSLSWTQQERINKQIILCTHKNKYLLTLTKYIFTSFCKCTLFELNWVSVLILCLWQVQDSFFISVLVEVIGCPCYIQSIICYIKSCILIKQKLPFSSFVKPYRW